MKAIDSKAQLSVEETSVQQKQYIQNYLNDAETSALVT